MPKALSDSIPSVWRDVKVLMTSHRESGKQIGESALKGKKGRVVDARFGRKTSSGLELRVQLSSYDPNKPFSEVWMDYDAVVELS